MKHKAIKILKNTQKMVFLAGVELKKVTPAWEDWINSFILREKIEACLGIFFTVNNELLIMVQSNKCGNVTLLRIQSKQLNFKILHKIDVIQTF